MHSQKSSRRQFLHWSGFAVTGTLLGACQPIDVERILSSLKLEKEQSTMTNGKGMISVTFQAIINDPEKRDEIIALFADINQLNPSGKDGCIIHDWYVNAWDPNRIRFYAEYESYEAGLAAEKQPAFIEANGKLFGYVQSGALTVQFENLRRFYLDNPLPPMHGMG